MSALLRTRFDAEKNSVIDSAMGHAEGWSKQVGNGRSGVLLDEIPRFLETLGLKVVDRSKCCVDRAVFQAFKTLAATAMSEPQKLIWEDES